MGKRRKSVPSADPPPALSPDFSEFLRTLGSQGKITTMNSDGQRVPMSVEESLRHFYLSQGKKKGPVTTMVITDSLAKNYGSNLVICYDPASPIYWGFHLLWISGQSDTARCCCFVFSFVPAKDMADFGNRFLDTFHLVMDRLVESGTIPGYQGRSPFEARLDTEVCQEIAKPIYEGMWDLDFKTSKMESVPGHIRSSFKKMCRDEFGSGDHW